jgi:competence protein ComEC
MKIKLALVILILWGSSIHAQEQVMYTHFIDMDQGLTTLLQFPAGIVMIDAGHQIDQGDDGPSQKKVLAYLNKFFTRNPQYNWTVDALIITHNHQDHTGSIPKIIAENKIKIKNIVTTKQHLGTDITNFVRPQGNINVEYVNYTDVIPFIPNGLTNAAIDPEQEQGGVDPEIKIFSGMNDAWKTGRFENPNFHSLAIRVKFGAASFLFIGDMETESIELLLDKYKNHTNVFDVDVYQVGHHGSDNATTKPLLNVMTPKIAVISAGKKGQKGSGSATDYGHPSIDVVMTLQEQIIEKRSKKIKGYGYHHFPKQTPSKAPKFTKSDITQKVYCTCWDGDVVIRATSNGTYIVN